MAREVELVVEILGHRMYLHWCPTCLLSQPFVRIFLRTGRDAATKAFCLVCGRDDVPDVVD